MVCYLSSASRLHIPGQISSILSCVQLVTSPSALPLFSSLPAWNLPLYLLFLSEFIYLAGLHLSSQPSQVNLLCPWLSPRILSSGWSPTSYFLPHFIGHRHSLLTGEAYKRLSVQLAFSMRTWSFFSLWKFEIIVNVQKFSIASIENLFVSFVCSP